METSFAVNTPNQTLSAIISRYTLEIDKAQKISLLRDYTVWTILYSTYSMNHTPIITFEILLNEIMFLNSTVKVDLTICQSNRLIDGQPMQVVANQSAV